MAADQPVRLHAVDTETHNLADALLRAGLDAAYQPIVHLGSGSVIAYEALARPRHPDVRNPLLFFSTLERAGLRLAGERTAFEAAVGGLGTAFPRVKLFINASPLTLVDPSFDVIELLDLAQQYGLATSDLVVEVTESEAVDDIDALAMRIAKLRRLGMGVAVDDAGAGHASFRVITRLRPSYIKLDRDLITGVDVDGARHAFVEAMVRFARQIGSRLIAEGIETEGELASLAGLGVEAGQGYFLARPTVGEFASPSDDARRMIAAAAQRLRLGAAQVCIGELARPAARVVPGVSVSEVQARFVANPALGMLVVAEPGHALAQLSRRSLERVLSAPHAWNELKDRPISELLDREPLTVVAQLDVVEVGAILAARQSQEVVDDVLVTDPRGGLVGVAAVRDILRTLAEVRHHGDQEVNPLSGLLGAGWLETELGRRLENGDAVTVVFLDVDGFSELNHVGGYALGDETIRSLARCLAGVTGGVAEAAVAHVGGDDFILIAPPRGFEELIGEVVRSVESEVVPFVRTELRQCSADGTATIGLSMAATDLFGEPPPGHRYFDWARGRLGALLRTAKERAGYSCVHRSDGELTLTTWSSRGQGRRRISLGKTEPSVVLRALDLIDRSWTTWWEDTEGRPAAAEVPSDRFPGPLEVIERLQKTYAAPLRAAAEKALAEERAVMEVVLQGDEEELLELLDRLALVTRSAYASRRLPIPAELALLDRLLRQRARVITREDVVVPQDL